MQSIERPDPTRQSLHTPTPPSLTGRPLEFSGKVRIFRHDIKSTLRFRLPRSNLLHHLSCSTLHPHSSTPNCRHGIKPGIGCARGGLCGAHEACAHAQPTLQVQKHIRHTSTHGSRRVRSKLLQTGGLVCCAAGHSSRGPYYYRLFAAAMKCISDHIW